MKVIGIHEGKQIAFLIDKTKCYDFYKSQLNEDAIKDYCAFHSLLEQVVKHCIDNNIVRIKGVMRSVKEMKDNKVFKTCAKKSTFIAGALFKKVYLKQGNFEGVYLPISPKHRDKRDFLLELLLDNANIIRNMSASEIQQFVKDSGLKTYKNKEWSLSSINKRIYAYGIECKHLRQKKRAKLEDSKPLTFKHFANQFLKVLKRIDCVESIQKVTASEIKFKLWNGWATISNTEKGFRLLFINFANDKVYTEICKRFIDVEYLKSIYKNKIYKEII